MPVPNKSATKTPDPNASELKLLTITAYTDESFSKKGDTYEALINPDKYSQNFQVEYNTTQGTGTSNATIKYSKSPPQEVSFELVLDGTGVVAAPALDVATDIENLKKVVYNYNGDIHKPNYVHVLWGGLDFQGCLTSMSINTTLFKPNGSPLRARISLTFKNFQSPKEIAAKAKKRSPDMTHERIVVAGDTLPAMTQAIYGNSMYYLKVAAFNRLENFRNLTPGTRISFPPLK